MRGLHPRPEGAIMLNWLKTRAARIGILGLPVVLAACVITTELPYFSSTDFTRPKIMDGNWISASTETGDQVLKLRISVNGKLWRAQPLTVSGGLDKSEKPVDFGLVRLSPSEFIVVHEDKPGEPIDYLGLQGQEDRLDFWVFSGGATPGGKAKFLELLKSMGLSSDAKTQYEARISGAIDKSKLKKLFKALLADPQKYDGHLVRYNRINP